MNKEAQEFFYELIGSFNGAYPDLQKVRELISRCYEAGVANGRLDTGSEAANLWHQLESDLGEMKGKIIGYERIYPKVSSRAPFGPMAEMETVRDVPKRELIIRWLDHGNAPTLAALLTEGIEKEKAKKV